MMGTPPQAGYHKHGAVRSTTKAAARRESLTRVALKRFELSGAVPLQQQKERCTVRCTVRRKVSVKVGQARDLMLRRLQSSAASSCKLDAAPCEAI